LLEVYLVHGYLFIHPTGQSFVDFLISLVLISVVAKLLSRIVNRVESLVFKKPMTAYKLLKWSCVSPRGLTAKPKVLNRIAFSDNIRNATSNRD
jgi:hypothetical protein